MTTQTRALVAVALGAVVLSFVVPLWWELLTTDLADRGGRTVLGFYLPVTAIFGVPGCLLLVLGVLVLLKQRGR